VPNYVAGDLRDQLAHAGFSVVSAGLVVGSGGNLSARVPDADTCWVTGAGTWLDRLNRPDFAEVDLTDGAMVSDGVPPSTEVQLHVATYRVRPDVHAIVHLHPQTALLLDALGERIRLVSTDHAVYLRRVVTTPFHPPGSAELAGVAAAAAADGTNCILLAHHGCSVLGETVEQAHKRALYLEEAARLTYAALAAGVLDKLPQCPVDGSLLSA
jgi:ribulose-5-phosphate 4-epimerase/fuculose-1-phosphate aldolase